MRVWALAVVLVTMLAGCAGTQEVAPGDDGFQGDVEEHIDDTRVVVSNGTGAVAGVVRNAYGAALGAAHVLVLGSPASTSSDDAGQFLLRDVPPGARTLRVDREGYLSLERTITVADGRVTRVNVTLADNTLGGPGFREHLHDLWRGQDEIAIFDQVVRHQHRYPPEGGAAIPCSRGGGFTASSGSCYHIPLVPEPGTIVPPGTASLSVSVDWEKIDYVPHVILSYQPANETAARSSPEIKPGDTLTIPVRHPMSDHGHQTDTQWALQLLAEPKIAGVSLSSQYFNEHAVGDFTVRIVAHKGAMPAEDPHPRYWKDGDTLQLLEETHKVAGLPFTRNPAATSCSQTSVCFVLPDQTVVPSGTTRLQVVFEYAANTPQLEDIMTRKTVAFRTAAERPADATLESVRVEPPVEIEFGRTVYELEIGEGEADPYYQARSNWLFLLANEGDERGERFLEDCYHFAAGCGGSTYTLRVVAINDNWTPELAGTQE